jgi:DNA-directed RNA polymerase specialized sigma24 family protein
VAPRAHGRAAAYTSAPSVPANDSTAWSMIVAAGAGELGARDRFARTYGGVIRAYLAARWRLPAAHDAVDDGTQEVFVQCFKQGGALHRVDPDGPARFRSYLYAVVKHVADRIERTNGVRRTPQEGAGPGLDDLERGDATLSRVFDRAWVAMLTRRAWLLMASRLEAGGSGGERLRILDLRFQQGLAPAAIAARLQLDAGHVYQQLRNAKRDFRAALLEVVGSYHPGATAAEVESRCAALVELL